MSSCLLTFALAPAAMAQTICAISGAMLGDPLDDCLGHTGQHCCPLPLAPGMPHVEVRRALLLPLPGPPWPDVALPQSTACRQRQP